VVTGNATPRRKLTPPEAVARKGGEKLAMVTAYDYPTARLAEAAGLDLLLVGDSLGMVVLGYASTAPVTMGEMLHHARAVVRGAPQTLVVVDLPFMAYQVGDAQAVENAGRLVKEGGADAVKLEGGAAMADRVRAIARAGIPVVGHVGLLPQTAAGQGGLRVQGRDLDGARAVLADAAAVAAAGAFALVVEAVPAELGALITERVPIPTIGIGAGPGCDGQVLVAADLLGLEDRLAPKFAKRYADLGAATRDAFAAYAAEVRAGAFPDAAYSYALRPEVAAALRRAADDEEAGRDGR
jgi:3-methyl-2-oxobutanoate hydroxymethyltransferase